MYRSIYVIEICLSDDYEINVSITDPNEADSDDDGLNDWAEINNHSTDPNDPDSDVPDNLSDGDEITYHLKMVISL